MNILLFSHYFPPEGNAPASRVHAMTRRWVAAGHQVTVVTCAPNVPDGKVYEGYRNVWCARETVDGVKVIRVKTFMAANRGVIRRLMNFLSYQLSATWRGLCESKPDVVIATSPQFFCGWTGVWVSRFKRVPLVLEIRDIWPESIHAVGMSGGGSSGKGLGMRYAEWLEKRMYRAAKHLITVGEGYRDKLLERGVPADRICVISNGVETALFRPRESDMSLREAAGAKTEDFLVGYIGTVGMAHGLEIMIELARLAAARELHWLKLVVVGDGARREELEGMLAKEDPGNIRFVGRQPKPQMPVWLASVDACLVHLRDTPLFQTVMPSKLFEALAMQRPVLLGVKGQAQTVLEQSGGGLSFTPEDAESLLACIEALHADRDGWRLRCEQASGWVCANYDLDVLAADYLCELERVLAGLPKQCGGYSA